MLQDIISQLNKRPVGDGYGNEVPRYNAFEQAPLLAQAITQFQKEQRVNPIAAALQNISSKWKAAQTDEERNALNAAANITRENFLQSGGSPMELSSSQWGADPTRGFQTGAEEFRPGYAGDNLSMGQRMNLASLTGMLNGQPTFQRQAQEATLTGMYDSEKTWPRQYQEQNMALQTALKNLQAAKLSQGSDSDSKRENLASAQTEIWEKLNAGVPLDQVEAWIVKNAGKYASAGLDYQDIIDYAWIAKSGAKRPKDLNDTPSGTSSGTSSQGRLLQKTNQTSSAAEPKSFKDVATTWLNDKYGIKTAEAGESGGGDIDAWINQSVSLTGVGEDWKPGLRWLAEHESTFDPSAKNPTAVGGEHATGLMQTLPSTFHENAMGGMNDIYNPVHNMAAAINYIKGRYGHPDNAIKDWASRGGY